ncbi:hypothetical protein MGYG_05275 [Nannizzia gypsea CBS 118893]|uniref:Uncharacterized protein n=1 Tax=Arthroderma gypseum (strain ATCC MYA-4604 / CBS 118893) TaxID=535722 RepID=E4UVE8_ARTGP|nr:hypothetical protein MGYG_05275 [Nannizzia gypsea CBS 118893]EFR02275.1 hypothetical protein MGYG_05275 [Nannizzia gypsea CBS 118893]
MSVSIATVCTCKREKWDLQEPDRKVRVYLESDMHELEYISCIPIGRCLLWDDQDGETKPTGSQGDYTRAS